MMTNWNALSNALSQAVLDNDRLSDVLDELGCGLREFGSGRILRGPCPVHGGRGNNCQVTTDGDDLPVRWACFSNNCQRKYKPSLLGLVRGVLSYEKGKDVSVWDAVRFLQRFAGDRPAGQPAPPPRPVAAPNLLSLTRQQVRGQLVIPSPYFLSRGFAPSVLDALDAGYSHKLNRSVVPVYNDGGSMCAGIFARSESPQCPECKEWHEAGLDCIFGAPKWITTQGFPKSQYVYNYAAARASEHPFVLLVEGPPDVFRATEAGFSAVSPFGTSLSRTQAEKLAALGKKVLVAFDNDHAGQLGTTSAVEVLRAQNVNVEARPVPDAHHDVGEMTAGQVRDWLAR